VELTERILASLRGHLGTTVSHPDVAGQLIVRGVTSDPVNFGWKLMPDSFRVEGRNVFCCEADWSLEPIFVFEDEVTVVDAPAEMVVSAMLDMLDTDTAYSLQHPEEDDDEDSDEDDWICEGQP
jgi:hypothetical protein